MQELIPGSGETQLAYCAFFRDGSPSASMVVRRLRQHPPLFGRASTFVETIEHPELEELSRAVPAPHRLLRPGRARVQARRARRPDEAARRQRSHLGLPQPRPARGRGLPLPAVRRPARRCRSPTGCVRRPACSWIRLATDVPTARRRADARDARLARRTCARCGRPTSSPCSAAMTRCPAWRSSRCCPTWRSSGASSVRARRGP